MFIVLKKRYLLISLALICILILSSFLVYFFVVKDRADTIPTSTVSDITVVLDAGHGGIDGGVTGINSKVTESVINMQITEKIQKLLVNQKINTILTRTANDDSMQSYEKGFKKKDMQKRKSIITSANPSVVISIHCNRFPDKTKRGIQTFYNKNSNPSKVLADIIQSSMNELNKETINKSYYALSGDYYILNCSKFPSVIIECGFLSNPDDDMLLNNTEYQEKLAYSVFCGIIDYLSTSK